MNLRNKFEILTWQPYFYLSSCQWERKSSFYEKFFFLSFIKFKIFFDFSFFTSSPSQKTWVQFFTTESHVMYFSTNKILLLLGLPSQNFKLISQIQNLSHLKALVIRKKMRGHLPSKKAWFLRYFNLKFQFYSFFGNKTSQQNLTIFWPPLLISINQTSAR